jgi:SAM-dependent methyltransferase
MSTDRDTVRSYDTVAAEYAAEAAAMPEWVATEIDAFVTELGGSGRVLEIGSGGGRDALALEKRGISVRRTDISKGFVELLRESGFEADLMDPLTEAELGSRCTNGLMSESIGQSGRSVAPHPTSRKLYAAH